MIRKKLKRLTALLCVSALAISTLSGCSKDPTAEDSTGAGNNSSVTQTAAGNTFTYAIGGDPGSNVNVITTSDRFGLMTIKMIYSPLLMYNADGENWFLAKSVDVSDETNANKIINSIIEDLKVAELVDLKVISKVIKAIIYK